MRIKKPSSMTASCVELVYPFHKLRCNRRHTHLEMMGQSRHLKSAETWTWTEANLILEGIKMLLKTNRTGRTSERIYPVIKALIPRVRRLGIEVARATPGVPQKVYDDRVPPKEESPCPGCRNGRANDDWTHTPGK